MATRNRRTPATPAPVENRVTAKRLSRLPDADRKKAAADFAKGTPIAEIVEKYGFVRVSNARYTVRQELVRQGKVPAIDGTDVKALKAALSAGDGYSDPAWVACRAGISGAKLSALVK